MNQPIRKINFPQSKRLAVIAAWSCILASALIASDTVATAESVNANLKVTLPKYTPAYNSGLYSTIVASTTIKNIKIRNYRDAYLQVDGFARPMPIRAVMQPGKAPLVVLLLGAEGQASERLAKKWVAMLSDCGYHVLTFSSTLNAEFVSVSGRGVSGNMANEAECARDIISAFLKSPMAQGKVERIGIVGLSFGGVEALLSGTMAAENKVDFKIDTIKAFSPPVDVMRSAERIDLWWNQDRMKHSMAELYFSVAAHKPVAAGAQVPLSDEMMRAGISASFLYSFAEIVERNDRVYRLHILPTGEDHESRLNRAAAYGFTRFLYRFTYPYWKDKLGLKDIGELNANAKLVNLLPREPDYAETIVADDDPLNRPEDLEQLQSAPNNVNLTIVNGGGHVGFPDDWLRAKLARLFRN